MRNVTVLPALVGCLALAGWAGPTHAATTAKTRLVGAWKAAASAQIVGLVLEPVAQSEGCLRRTGGRRIEVDDHPDARSGLFWKAHDAPPGLYAIVGVRWANEGYPASYFGISRQTGPLWTFKVTAAATTDIGVWPIRSPYRDSFVVERPEIADTQATARSLAGSGALLLAEPVRAVVVDEKDPCVP